MLNYPDYKTFSELAKIAKLHPKVLKAAKILADKKLEELKFYMKLTNTELR